MRCERALRTWYNRSLSHRMKRRNTWRPSHSHGWSFSYQAISFPPTWRATDSLLPISQRAKSSCSACELPTTSPVLPSGTISAARLHFVGEGQGSDEQVWPRCADGAASDRATRPIEACGSLTIARRMERCLSLGPPRPHAIALLLNRCPPDIATRGKFLTRPGERGWPQAFH
jgi:hypothetical protein